MHNLCVCNVWADENYSRTQFLISNTSLIDNGKVFGIVDICFDDKPRRRDDHVGKVDNQFHKCAIITSYYPKFVMRNFFKSSTINYEMRPCR